MMIKAFLIGSVLTFGLTASTLLSAEGNKQDEVIIVEKITAPTRADFTAIIAAPYRIEKQIKALKQSGVAGDRAKRALHQKNKIVQDLLETRFDFLWDLARNTEEQNALRDALACARNVDFWVECTSEKAPVVEVKVIEKDISIKEKLDALFR
jgi:hypothetical protein